MHTHKRRPPSFKVVMACFLGVGPFLWMPCLVALQSLSSPALFAGWPSAAQWLSHFGTVLFLGFWWWVMAFAGGMWAATIAPTLLAAAATWKLLHLIGRKYPNSCRVPVARFAISFASAGSASALAFFLFTLASPGFSGLFLMGAVALVGGILGLLLGLCFRKADPGGGVSSPVAPSLPDTPVESRVAQTNTDGNRYQRDTFDAMPSAEDVKAWFRSKDNWFFQEWPRGSGPLFTATRAARECRHGASLGAFADRLEAFWHDPHTGDNPFKHGV